MVLPRKLAILNKSLTNRVLGRIAGRAPGFAIVVHYGRSSGRRYRTPVNLFRDPSGYVIALTYGSDADWVRNVLTGDGCTLVARGKVVPAARPRIVHDPQQNPVPRPVGLLLSLVGVSDFLILDEERG